MSFFSSFSILGIYDLTGCNRPDKAIHHAGLMWESKFNLVSLLYKYWPFWEHTEHIYLSVKSRLYSMSNKFLRSEVQEKGVSVLRVIDTGNTLPGMGERLCILLCPRPLLFYSNFITGYFISIFTSIFIFKGQ